MIRVSYAAIEGAAERVGRVSGDLGCGTPIGAIAGAADETPAAGALDAVAHAWMQTLALQRRQCLDLRAALAAAADCYSFADASTATLFQRAQVRGGS
jgi:hypothetical protein